MNEGGHRLARAAAQVAGSRLPRCSTGVLTIRLSRRSEDSGSSRRTRCPLSTIRSLDDPPPSPLFHQRLPLFQGNEIYSGSDSSRVPTGGSTSFPSPAFFPEKRSLVSFFLPSFLSFLLSFLQPRPFSRETITHDSSIWFFFLFFFYLEAFLAEI